MTHDFHDFHEQSAMVVLARKFVLETLCFSSILFLFWIIPPIIENSGRANEYWLFDTGFSFKNIYDLQEDKGGLSLQHLSATSTRLTVE